MANPLMSHNPSATAMNPQPSAVTATPPEKLPRTLGLWSSIGSMNFDNRSLAFNNETTLLILDRRVVAGMDSMFLNDLKASHEMTLQEEQHHDAGQHAEQVQPGLGPGTAQQGKGEVSEKGHPQHQVTLRSMGRGRQT